MERATDFCVLHFIWKAHRHNRREATATRTVFYLLAHSPKCPNSHVWTMLWPGAESSVWVFHMGDRASAVSWNGNLSRNSNTKKSLIRNPSVPSSILSVVTNTCPIFKFHHTRNKTETKHIVAGPFCPWILPVSFLVPDGHLFSSFVCNSPSSSRWSH